MNKQDIIEQFMQITYDIGYYVGKGESGEKHHIVAIMERKRLRAELAARLAAADEVAAAVSDVPPGSGDPVEFLAGAVEYARVNYENNMADWLEGVVDALRAYREARGEEAE